MKRLVIIIPLCFAIMLCACQKSSDINERIIVQGIGIDYLNENETELTVQVLNTSSYSGIGGAKVPDNLVKNYHLKGKSVADALSKLPSTAGKEPLYTHTRIVLVGKSQAQKGLKDVLDFFSRDSSCHAGLFICVCENTASEILSGEIANQSIPSVEIENAVNASQFGGDTADVHIYELIKMYREKSTSAFLPVASLNGDAVKISKTASFTGDRMTGEINSDDTFLLMLFMNKITSASYTLTSFEDGKVSFAFYKSKCKTKSVTHNGKTVFRVNLKCTLDCIEYSGKSELDKSTQRQIEKKLENELKEKMTSFLYKMSQSGTDCMRLGRILLLQNKNAYSVYENDWENALKSFGFEVNVNVSLRRIGQESGKSAL